MSILNVNKINPVGGGSTITITGIASVTNNISVGNSVTATDVIVTNVSASSSVTATTFHGDGSNLTGIDATSIKHTDGNVKIQANNSGSIVTGILTVTKNEDAKIILKGDSVGVGTTSTTGRNSGVSTATGTLIFNSTEGTLQVYNGRGWDSCSNIFTATGGNTTYTQGAYKVHVFTSNGDFVSDGSGSVDVLVVAGGGGGGATSRPNHNGAWAGGGGAGGVLYTPGHPLTAATYPVVIGGGGAVGANGSNSTALGLTAVGGGRGGGSPYPSPTNGGAAGGSGGGGLGDHSPAPSRAGGAGTSGQGNAGGVGIDPGGGPDNYEQGGGGGGAGEAGNTDGNGYGGDGRDMSAEFGTTYGESGVFGGGGAGGSGTSGASTNEGGVGGGGNSGHGHTSNSASEAGAANTGGGGGAGGNTGGGGGQPGGPGIVLIRYLA